MAFVRSTASRAAIASPNVYTAINHTTYSCHLPALPESRLRADGTTTSLSENQDLQPLLHSLYKYCLHLTRCSWDAEDLMQETCLKTMPLLTDPAAVPDMNREAYILRTARNLWIDIMRRRTTQQSKLILLQATADEMHSASDSLQQRLECEWAAAMLLRQLSPWQHAVFVLRDLLGYPAAEAARLLDTTEGAIKSALHRARTAISALRDRITKNDDSDADNLLLSLPLPGEQDQELLRSYLSAFRSGQAEEIVRLLLDTSVDPIAIAPRIIRQSHCKLQQTIRDTQRTPHVTLSSSGARMLMSA